MRSKSPTDTDKKKLELLGRFLNGDEISITCGCGEDEACSECGIELTSDDLYTRHHDVGRLSIRVSIVNLDPKSKVAVRYNADDDFADVVDLIEEQMNLTLEASGKASKEDLRTVENFAEAVDLIGRMKGPAMQEIPEEKVES